MAVIAKPVIDKKFWILTEDNIKIGNLEANNSGYQLSLHNNVTQCKSIKNVERMLDVRFEPTYTVKTPTNTVHGFPAGKSIYNAVWDLARNLPLFTKTKKSKCWVAAGWYRITRNDVTSTVHCPKLILLQRYEYTGPFYTEEEANQ